jgi:hypothetical protein
MLHVACLEFILEVSVLYALWHSLRTLLAEAGEQQLRDMLFCFAEFALLLYGRCHLHHFGLPRASGHERDTRSINCAAEHRRM